MLQAVTLTGADNSVQPEDLFVLQRQYPLLEWGVLLGDWNHSRASRFPNRDWLEQFVALAREHEGSRQALHLCDQWVERLVQGDGSIVEDIGREIWSVFQRVQLNFHGQPQRPCDAFYDILASYPQKEFIFQVDGNMGQSLLEEYYATGHANAVPLFDTSHGAGVLPNVWPSAVYMVDDESYAKHGYAGGLGPDNVKEQLPHIVAAAKGGPFWIDMETKLFSNRRFDLHRCRQVLDRTLEFFSGE